MWLVEWIHLLVAGITWMHFGGIASYFYVKGKKKSIYLNYLLYLSQTLSLKLDNYSTVSANYAS